MVNSQALGLWWWEDFSAVAVPRRRVIAVLVIVFGVASIALIGGIDNPRYLVYVATGLHEALQAESNKGMLTRGYLPLAEATAPSSGNCFVVVLRKPEQFTLDQATGKDPMIGENCVRIPPLIYWEGVRLNFMPPS